MELTGAQVLLECLQREGVEVMFGYPGGAVIDIYDQIPESPIKHVLVRHEQGAIHAADGYARASGKVGCCLVTSGPGATNTVTGIATAYMDSIPVVIITGQVPTPLIGNDAFQEVDIIGITRPCTKHNYLVKDIKKLALTIRRAFYLARSGRPGPVLVDLPKDIQQAKVKFEWPSDDDVLMRSYNPTIKPNVKQLRRATEMLARAKRPLVYAGGGVISANAHENLTWLVRTLKLPVTATLMGLGCFPSSDPQWLGMLGMHGTYAANRAVQNADVILAIGARFDDRVTGKISTFAPKAKLIHVDIDPTSIQKNVQVHLPIVADCASALQVMRQELEELLDHPETNRRHQDWWSEIDTWRTEHPLGFKPKEGFIKPQEVIRILRKLTKGEAIVSTEVGQNQMWTAQFYDFEQPRSLLTSGGLGTMGYGFPAAIGAQMAFPDRLVLDVAGDGSIQMNIQEMATAACHRLPIKIIILNNAYLGMVRQWQELFYEENYCATCMESQPDFVKLAEAYGAAGIRIEKPEELEPKLQEALTNGRLTIVDIRIPQEENVYPMVPAGKSLTDMLLV